MEKPRVTRGWPPERRRAQAERIRNQQPWRQSTGPRTTAGKQKMAENPCTHGMRTHDMNNLRRVLRLQRDYIRNLRASTPGLTHPSNPINS